MPWAELIGNERAIETLRRAIRDDRLHHALLFHGPEGVGKRLAARLLAQALLCERRRDRLDDPCGDCSACRRIAGGSHPDVVDVGLGTSSSTGKQRQEIVIDQVRDLCRFLCFNPLEGERRVAFVDPADHLNVSAANAFLKTLEEPPPRSVIVLIARNRFNLLETIRSRCLPIVFAPVPTAAIERALLATGAPAEDARLASALADGAIGLARSLLPCREDEEQPAGKPAPLEAYRRRRDRILDALRDAAGGRAGPGTRVIRAAEAFSPKAPEEFLPSFDIAVALLRDALLVASGAGEPVAAADAVESIRALASALGAARAASAIAAAESIRSDLRVNVSRQLAAECLLLELAR